ncbi:hypothetical protein Agub_g11937 [Astrephomene gubernaculifera]|uniref:Peptidase C1A papain C-terminal domain-containing protein n=1 Tax=Astrephomene gubernaculifera TaxID=47775 RepID=A0AAD3E1Q7_9CHLO|nr:hypothetical protein Agub_g11937 [Astrephomene gubernaculifera]
MDLRFAIGLTICLLAGQSLASPRLGVERQGRVDAPAPPRWPDAYEMEYTLTLPYVETFQTGGLKYPVHVWWDGPNQRYRLDVYGGMDSSGYDNTKGISWNLYPRISEVVCDFSNGTAGPTITSAITGGGSSGGVPRRARLQEGGSSTPLPDISGWSYAGTAALGNAQALVWQLSSRTGEKTATYTLYTAPNGWPLRFDMMGLNVLTGSHFDEYIIEFTRFKPGTPPDAAFALPAACEEEGQQQQRGGSSQGQGQGGQVGGSLAAQLATLLPSVRLGAVSASASSSGPLSLLRAQSLSALAANTRLVAQHNQQQQQQQQLKQTALSTSSASTPTPPTPTYSLSLNHFAHLSHEQWAATMLGLNRKTKTTQQQTQQGANTASASTSSSSTSSSPRKRAYYRRVLSDSQLPPAVDWRGSGADGPGVKDQVSCGSCWAFSAVGAMQGAWFQATGQSLSFSEQQLVDCSWEYDNNGCAGGNVEPALQYVADAGGIAQEADYPYLGQNAFCRAPAPSPSNTSSSLSSSRSSPPAPLSGRFSGFLNVPPRDEGALMEALALHGPVAVVMHAALPPFKFYSEGVYYNDKCKTDPDHMDHAILLVGYGSTAEGVDYWLIKNSWSKYWGMDGYARIARKGNDCGITTDPVLALVEPGVGEQGVGVEQQLEQVEHQ